MVIAAIFIGLVAAFALGYRFGLSKYSETMKYIIRSND